MPSRSKHILSPLLGLFFRLLYHQLAWVYDLVAWSVSLGRWKTWVLSVLPDLPGPRVLELGHGPGHLQAALHAQKIETVGLDRSPQMGRIAHGRLKSGRNAARLVQGEAQTLPFPAESFHQVVATFPTEYIAERETLVEIRRVLVAGGTLVVLPVAWITGGRWWDRAAAWLFRVTGQAEEIEEESSKTLLNQAGFEAQIEYRDLGTSRVLVIRARKNS